MRGTPSAEVTLGDHTLPVYAQRHAYLANRLGRFIDKLLDNVGELDSGSIVGLLQESSYELLSALIPNLSKRIPEYEYRGYATREAMAAGDYDPETDKSPTLPEIREAFTVASRVNAFDVIGHLGRVIDPSLLRGIVNEQVATAISQTSQTSPSESGGSDSMSSGTTPPASTVSAA